MGRVLVAGHVNWDVTLSVDRIPGPDDEAKIRAQQSAGGGSAANVALGLTTFSLEAALLGSVGDDEYGRSARETLSAGGVDCGLLRTVPGAETTTKYVLVDEQGEVAVIGNDGVNEAIGPDDVDREVVQGFDHVHLTSQRPATAARIAQVATDAGIPVSFDPGRRIGDRTYEGTLELTDLIFVNDREAKRGLGGNLDDSGRTVVIKQGERGAIAHAGGETVTHPGFSVEAVDTTGAGDAFAAGYLARRLRGDDVANALEFANACGALVTTRDGARTVPSESAVSAFIADRS